MYGHTARIWKVRPLDTCSQLRLVSSSEDVTVRVWHVSKEGTWEEQACLGLHIGKNVRAIDVHEGVIASGGEDSAIYLTDSSSLTAANPEGRDVPGGGAKRID